MRRGLYNLLKVDRRPDLFCVNIAIFLQKRYIKIVLIMEQLLWDVAPTKKFKDNR